MRNADVNLILAENRRRNDALFKEYNPYAGYGSLIDREEILLKGEEMVYIPTYLWKTDVFQDIVSCGSLAEYSLTINTTYSDVLDWFNEMRIKYDFEYWAAVCVKIKDKKTGKISPFILRQPQRKLLALLVADLFGNIPVRIILLKARQWGGSTLIQLFLAWIQLFHRENWNSAIAAHIKEASRNIRAMYSFMAERHPKDIMDVKLEPFEQSQTTKIIKSRGCVISVASVRNPESLRSGDLKLAHLSEVGLWQDNKMTKGDDLAQSIIGSVTDEPYTVIALESTAKGIGNYFYREWQKAVEGNSSFRPLFIAWFEIDLYWREFVSDTDRIEFINSMTEEEWMRWGLGATLEALNWYRFKLKSMPSAFRMRQEYPSTPQEAFATTNRNVHDESDITFLRQGCCEPKYKGSLVASAQYGVEAIGSSMHLVTSETGDLWIWSLPDRERIVRNRYIVSLDIGGRSDDADWSVASVIDRYPLISGGCEECVATWRFHLDHDLTAWRAAQLAKFYNNALLVVEINSLDRISTEGDYSYTILDEIVEYYPNMYFRDDPTKVRQGVAPHYGFHTGHSEKVEIVTHWQYRLREKRLIERDARVLDEVGWFEQKDRRDTYGAIDGKHDDMYMSRGIGLYVSSKMDLPVEFDQEEVERARAKRAKTNNVRTIANI